MRLGDAAADRFYRIWWSLLAYVNKEMALFEELKIRRRDGAIEFGQAVELRDALWKEEALLEQFVAQNPVGLSTRDLATASGWAHRVEGQFIIVRYLNRYTVLLDGKGNGYAVLGLYSSIDEIAGEELPQVIETVLLPFEDRIVIDGIVRKPYITLGPGIRRALAGEYRRLRHDSRIRRSL